MRRSLGGIQGRHMIFETGFSIVVVLFTVYLLVRIIVFQINKITLGEPDIIITRSLRELFGIGLGTLFLILSIYYFYDDAITTNMNYYDIASSVFRIIASLEIVFVSLVEKRFYEKGLLMLYDFINWDEVKYYNFEGPDMNKLIMTLKKWKHFTNNVHLQVQKKQLEEVKIYLARKIVIEDIQANRVLKNDNEVEIENSPSENKITLYLIPVIIILLLGLVFVGLLSQ